MKIALGAFAHVSQNWDSRVGFKLSQQKYDEVACEKAVTLETVRNVSQTSGRKHMLPHTVPALRPEDKRQLTARWASGRTPRHQSWSCWWRSGWDEAPAASASHKASLWLSQLGCFGPAAYTDRKNQNRIKVHYLVSSKKTRLQPITYSYCY